MAVRRDDEVVRTRALEGKVERALISEYSACYEPWINNLPEMAPRQPEKNRGTGGMSHVTVRWSCIWLGIIVALSVGGVAAQEFYEWTDDGGTIHFTDSMGNVPAKYRRNLTTYGKKDEESADDVSSGRQPRQKSEGRPQTAASAPRPQRVGGAREPVFKIHYDPFEGSAARIIVVVRLNGRTEARLAVDTGAPSMILFEPLAQRLGLFQAGQGQLLVTTGGIGGTTPAIRTLLSSVEVAGARLDMVPATVTESMSTAFEGLLGMSFLSRYNLEIDGASSTLFLRQRPTMGEYVGGYDKAGWKRLFKEFGQHRDRWEKYRDEMDAYIRSPSASHGPSSSEARELHKLALKQYQEASTLYARLQRYAARHAVPKHWRYY